MADFDLILVGGGLSSGLIADRVSATDPACRTLIVEAQSDIGGNHTWSFHESDVTPAQDQWLQPFRRAAWPDQHLYFPRFDRIQPTGYRSLSSDTFRDRIASLPQLAVATSSPVTTIADDGVTLDGGQTISAHCVIDCRGADPAALNALAVGYQKFVGLEVRLATPHGLTRPIIMDARVPQIDGYRFIYVLPFSETELLIEDTYYSDTATFDADVAAQNCEAYARKNGWPISEILRTEIGALPIILDGRLDAIWPAEQTAARAGMRAGLFQQTTGYSLPLAARAAEAIAAVQHRTSANVADVMRQMATDAWRDQWYFRLLNRTMFLAGDPLQRRKIFERFYTLSTPLIERFYAGRFSTRDKLRLLTGKPPVPMFRAFWAFAPVAARHRRPGPHQGAPRPSAVESSTAPSLNGARSTADLAILNRSG